MRWRKLAWLVLLGPGGAGCESCDFSFGPISRTIHFPDCDPERFAQMEVEVCDSQEENCTEISPLEDPNVACGLEIAGGYRSNALGSCSPADQVVRLSLAGCGTIEVVLDEDFGAGFVDWECVIPG